MMLVMPWQKTCPNCLNQYLTPDVYAKPYTSEELKDMGNPWHCEKCKERFVCNDGTKYKDHIQMIVEHYQYEEGFEETDETVLDGEKKE